MGAGIAKQIKDNFPEAYQVDLRTGKGKDKLGTVSYCEIFDGNNKLRIVNAYTQYYPGANFSENALAKCLKWVNENCDKMKIAYPRIGCGIGGGSWDRVSKIIDRELQSKLHTLIEYVPSEVNDVN